MFRRVEEGTTTVHDATRIKIIMIGAVLFGCGIGIMGVGMVLLLF